MNIGDQIIFQQKEGFGLEFAKEAFQLFTNVVEYRKAIGRPAPGRVLVETEHGALKESTKRLEPALGVVSDTYGLEFEKSYEENLSPIAIAGRVLVFPYENREGFRIGDPVCAGPGGTASLMTREEVKLWPDRIIGIVANVPGERFCGKDDEICINGRIWIKVM